MYKDLIENKKAVIFDLDGTVVETSVLKDTAFQNVLNNNGLSYIDASYYKTNGVQDKKRLEIILSLPHVRTEKTFEQLFIETEDEYIKLVNNSDMDVKDGFWDLIYELKEEKGFKTALTTNSTKRTALAVMNKVGIVDDFDVVLFIDDVKKPKPDPEIYIKTAEKLNLKTKEVLVFEDSPVGARAADKAKMKLVVIWNGETPKIEYPGKTLLYLSDFKELPGRMDESSIEAVVRAAAERAKLNETKG